MTNKEKFISFFVVAIALFSPAFCKAALNVTAIHSAGELGNAQPGDYVVQAPGYTRIISRGPAADATRAWLQANPSVQPDGNGDFIVPDNLVENFSNNISVNPQNGPGNSGSGLQDALDASNRDTLEDATNSESKPGVIGQAGNFIMYLFGLVLYLVSVVVGLLLYFAGLLVDFFFSANQLASSKIVQSGWLFTRDTLNFVFILVLLAISFSTIAGIDTLTMKKALPSLIFAALLVNFSLAIAGAFLQVSNVMTTSIANSILKGTKVEGMSVGTALATGLTDSSNVGQFYTYGNVSWLNGILGENSKVLLPKQGKDAISFENISQKETTQYFMITVKSTIALVMICIFAAAFIFLAALMAIRIVMLVILLILSPVPFVFSIIPKTKPYADKWWSNFINYVMFLPVATFFLALAIKLMDTNKAGDTTTLVSQFFKKGTEVKFVTSGLVGSIIDMVFISVFIFASLLVAKTLGILGASAITGVAKRTGMGAARIGAFPAVAAGKMTGHGAAKVGLVAADKAGNLAAKTPLVGSALRGARTAGRAAQRLYKGQESRDQLAEKEKALAGMSEGELRGAFKRGNVAAGMKLMGNDDLEKEEYADLSAKVPKSTEAYDKVQSNWKRKDPINAIVKSASTREQMKSGSVKLDDAVKTDLQKAFTKMKSEDYAKLTATDLKMARNSGISMPMSRSQLKAVADSSNVELQAEASSLIKELEENGKELNPGQKALVKEAQRINFNNEKKSTPGTSGESGGSGI